MDLVAYRRVSTAGQVDRYGLAEQDRDMHAYAAREGHRVVRTETDGAKSGTLPAEKRPALLAALRAVRSGQAGGLLLPNLDRLSRKLIVQEAVLAQVWDAGGEVHTADHGLELQDDPDDPIRTAIRQMRGVFAQLERAMIVKRMRNGRAMKASQGGFAYGSPALGYRAEGKQLVPDSAEQAVLARIRELDGQGASLREIAAALTAEGIPTKRGGTWHPSTVARALGRRYKRTRLPKPA